MFNAKSILDALVKAGSQAGTGTGQPGSGQLGLGQGGLGQIASQIQQGLQSGGGVGGILGSVLTQATQGLQQAGQDVATRTGAGGRVDQAVGQVTGGKSAADLVAQIKTMAGQNQLATGAVIGALGGLLFGTRSGRSIATSAAKLGGLALIGGLAYKAYQNYSAGKPILNTDPQALPAPSGSGFEPEAANDATAILFIRAMIAAAAADGHIDEAERAAVTQGFEAAGFDAEARAWLEQELARPASVDELVAGATTTEIAAQVYTAARLAINPDQQVEKDFLAGLAGSLNLDAELIAHIDAAAAGAKV